MVGPTMLPRPLPSAALPLIVLLAGCLEPDPAHCANQGGDAACSEGLLCSICTADNHGCQPTIELNTCRADEPGDTLADGGVDTEPLPTTTEDGATTDAPTTSSGLDTDSPTGDGTSTEGGTTTGADSDSSEPCDPSCSAATPVCTAGQCEPCTAAPDTCPVDADTCFEDWGGCVACLSDNACPSSFCSDSYTCAGCTIATQCGDDVCNPESGQCEPEDTALTVAPGPTCEDDPELRLDPATPFCTLQGAIDTVETAATALIVLQGGGVFDGDASISGGKTITIAGRQGLPRIRGTVRGLRVAGSSTVHLSAVRFADIEQGPAIQCLGGSTITIRDTTLENAAQAGIDANRCTLELDRVTVVSNGGPGIDLGVDPQSNEGSSLTLRSSIVGCNGEAGLLVDRSSFRVLYSTIAANTGDSVACNGAGDVREVADSIVLDGSIGECLGATVETSLEDDGVLADFRDSCDLRIREGAEVDAVARWDLGDPRIDVEGQLRRPVPGGMEVPGADQG